VWQLCQELGAELYMSVNAHTQTPEDAANLVEYLNGTRHTMYAEMRRAHGHDAPYKVKYFGLGNEIYGNWQPGQKTAAEYAAWCAEAIRQMKDVDPSIHVVVCGLGRPDPEWDRTVLFRLIGLADSISAHNYFGRPLFPDLMAASAVCEEMFCGLRQLINEAMDTTLGVHSRAWRDLGALPEVKRRPGIAFDEWNVWYRSSHGSTNDLEEIYHYADALTVASIFHVILRHADMIDIANISLAVNTLAPIFTVDDKMTLQTIWFAQKLIRDAHPNGRVVKAVVDGPTFAAKHERFFCGIVDSEKAKDETLPSLLHFDAIPAVDAAVTIDDAAKRLNVSLIQKLEDRPLNVTLDLRGAALNTTAPVKISHLTRNGDIWVENTVDSPHNVGLATTTIPFTTHHTLAPASLTTLEYQLL